MEMKIEIHDDYCTDVSSDKIQAILAEITALVSEAVLRSVTEDAA